MKFPKFQTVSRKSHHPVETIKVLILIKSKLILQETFSSILTHISMSGRGVLINLEVC